MNGVRDVSPGRNIQLIPFAFVRSYDVLEADGPNGPGFTEDTEDDIGLDAKIVLQATASYSTSPTTPTSARWSRISRR